MRVISFYCMVQVMTWYLPVRRQAVTWIKADSLSRTNFNYLLRLRQNRRHFVDIFKSIFLNENALISIEISLKFIPKGPINNILVVVQIMAWRRPGDKPLSESVMISLLTHIYVTPSRWVNILTEVVNPEMLMSLLWWRFHRRLCRHKWLPTSGKTFLQITKFVIQWIKCLVSVTFPPGPLCILSWPWSPYTSSYARRA